MKEYGPSLSLNLLGKRDMEPLLTEAFQDHISELSLPGATQYIHFDYHSHCRPGHMEALESILLPQCDEFLERCGYYLERGGAVEKGQMGVVRHNCLDCLDRSNNAQALLGITVTIFITIYHIVSILTNVFDISLIGLTTAITGYGCGFEGTHINEIHGAVQVLLDTKWRQHQQILCRNKST